MWLGLRPRNGQKRVFLPIHGGGVETFPNAAIAAASAAGCGRRRRWTQAQVQPAGLALQACENGLCSGRVCKRYQSGQFHGVYILITRVQCLCVWDGNHSK